MTSKTRRLLTATALTAALGLTLAACGSDSQDEPSSTPTQAGDSSALPSVDAEVGDLELTGFWIRESSLDLAAGFGTITNTGAQDDALVAASAEALPTIELHRTVDGVMQRVDAMPTAAGESLVLEPGGNHLMFLDLTEPLAAGDEVALTLSFESGESVDLAVPVRPFSSSAMHDGHDHADGHDEESMHDGHDHADEHGDEPMHDGHDHS